MHLSFSVQFDALQIRLCCCAGHEYGPRQAGRLDDRTKHKRYKRGHAGVKYAGAPSDILARAMVCGRGLGLGASGRGTRSRGVQVVTGKS
jgi:hypothetical protein